MRANRAVLKLWMKSSRLGLKRSTLVAFANFFLHVIENHRSSSFLPSFLLFVYFSGVSVSVY